MTRNELLLRVMKWILLHSQKFWEKSNARYCHDQRSSSKKCHKGWQLRCGVFQALLELTEFKNFVWVYHDSFHWLNLRNYKHLPRQLLPNLYANDLQQLVIPDVCGYFKVFWRTTSSSALNGSPWRQTHCHCQSQWSPSDASALHPRTSDYTRRDSSLWSPVTEIRF